MASQGPGRLYVKIESRVQVVEQEAHHHQDYPVLRSFYLVSKTQGLEIHLRR